MMTKDNLHSFDWLFDQRYRWLKHLLFWMFIYIDPLLSLVGNVELPFGKTYQEAFIQHYVRKI